MPEPVNPPLEKPQIAPRRRSGSRLADVVPLPPPPEPAEAAMTTPTPAPEPMPVPEPARQTIMVSVNGQPFPIHIEAPAARAELGLSDTPSGEAPQPHAMPPADAEPIPGCREVGGGFACRIIDPTIARHLSTEENFSEREYLFIRLENGDYIYRDPDLHNEIIIHPDGTMEDRTNIISRPADRGLLYPVFDLFSGNLPWDIPPIPHYMWSAAEAATAETRQRIAEITDMANVNQALEGLHQELMGIIKRHPEWSLVEQHDFLFRRWDECREDSVGNEARTAIEEFIRQHYPQGGRLKFTEEEIREFNGHRATEGMSFCPYGCLPGMNLSEPQLGDSL
jgi:hypothetical protein